VKQLREFAAERLELATKDSTIRKRKFENEIMQTRKYFRSLGILTSPSGSLVAMNEPEQFLDPCFFNYIRFSEANKKKYFMDYLEGIKTHLPVLDTHADVVQMETVSQRELLEAIKRKINQLKEPLFSYYKRTVGKSSTLEDARGIYKALTASLEIQNSDATFEDMEDNFYLT